MNLRLKLFLIALSVFFIASNQAAGAEDLSIGIDPTILQIEAKPPANVNSPITIQNDSDQTTTYAIFLFPFKAGELNNGLPEYDSGLMPVYKHIFSRIQVIDNNRSVTQVSLGPKQKKELNLRISIPKDEPAKDYYFSVVFSSQENEEQDQNSFVGARGGIGTNVLLSIGPSSPTKGYIKEFSTSKFLTGGPVPFKLDVANTSSHYTSVKGNIVIKNIFGQAVGNIDLTPTNILANSDRLIQSSDNKNYNEPRIYWNEKFILGIYKADLALSLSDQGPILKKSLTFFAFPLQAAVLLILLIALTVGIIRRARSKNEL